MRTRTPVQGGPTTAPTRRSTCPIPTATASSWRPTAPRAPGRHRASARRRPRSRSTSRTCSPRRRRGPGGAGRRRACAVGPPAPARRRPGRRRALLPRRARLRRAMAILDRGRSCRPAATTITSASTSWRGRERRRPSAGRHTVGLRHWTVDGPDGATLAAVRRACGPSGRRSSRARRACSSAIRPGSPSRRRSRSRR